MNPRYLLWLRATGGGPNWEFMAWVRRCAVAYLAERGLGRDASIANQDDFTVWIERTT